MFREIFLKRWVVVGNALLLSYSIATSFRDAFSPQTQQKYQLNLLLYHWSWQTWIAVFAVLNFLIVYHGASLAIKRREEERDKLANKLEEIEKARPRIKLKEPDAIFIHSVSQDWGGYHFNSVPFLNVRFINDPAGPYPSAKANDVRATISFYRSSDNEHLITIDGRWADSDQPSASSPLVSKIQLLATTFGIGQTHELDIAYRDARTGQCSAWNNDNYSHPFFRCENHFLTGDQFRVDVRLRGDWVDESYSFTFKLTKDGFGLGAV